MHGGAHCDALGAGSDGIGGILDVCACDYVRGGVCCCCGGGGGRDGGVEEEGGADAEEGVWAFG